MEQLLPVLDASNIKLSKQDTHVNRLMVDSECGTYRFLVLRGNDATTYVRLGAADVGMVGKDMLLEFGYDNLYELLDMKVGRCKLMTAAPKNAPAPIGQLRVAAKYVNVARRFYSQRGQPAQVIPLYGALELAPTVGISDQIVDIVDTGNTLKDNNLQPLESIAEISTRFIANRAAMKLRYNDISRLQERLASAVTS